MALAGASPGGLASGTVGEVSGLASNLVGPSPASVGAVSGVSTFTFFVSATLSRGTTFWNASTGLPSSAPCMNSSQIGSAAKAQPGWKPGQKPLPPFPKPTLRAKPPPRPYLPRKILRRPPVLAVSVYFYPQSRPLGLNPAGYRNAQVSRGAGVSPAIFPISTHRKNAGETPAPQNSTRQAHCMAYLPNSEFLLRNQVLGVVCLCRSRLCSARA